MTEGQPREINTTRSGHFETEGTKFRHNMDPRAEDIYVNEKRVGILKWHDGRFKVRFSESMDIPLALFADILRERARILNDQEERRTTGIEIPEI